MAVTYENLETAIRDKIAIHYWNHHGSRAPSPEFVADLTGTLLIVCAEHAGSLQERK